MTDSREEASRRLGGPAYIETRPIDRFGFGNGRNREWHEGDGFGHGRGYRGHINGGGDGWGRGDGWYDGTGNGGGDGRNAGVGVPKSVGDGNLVRGFPRAPAPAMTDPREEAARRLGGPAYIETRPIDGFGVGDGDTGASDGRGWGGGDRDDDGGWFGDGDGFGDGLGGGDGDGHGLGTFAGPRTGSYELGTGNGFSRPLPRGPSAALLRLTPAVRQVPSTYSVTPAGRGRDL